MIPFLHRIAPVTQEDNPLWLVVLCDMMTNLMLFFLVMYSFTLQRPEARERWRRLFDASAVVEDPKIRRADEILRRFEEDEAAAALRELLKRAQLSGTVEVIETERGIRVRLRDKLLFATGQAVLSAEAVRPLGLLAQVLRQIPNTIVVEGHTDDVPIAGGPYRTNWELSVARSYSVLERLEAEGVAPRRLVASGYGEWHPAVANADPGGRGRNRRVEIVILRGADDDKAAVP